MECLFIGPLYSKTRSPRKKGQVIAT
jgi:hypothetical protein